MQRNVVKRGAGESLASSPAITQEVFGPSRASSKSVRSEQPENSSDIARQQGRKPFLPPKVSAVPAHISAPGQRRDVPKLQPIPLKWPTESKEQFRVFDAWHEIAMQIVDQAGKPFRLMAVYRRCLFWREGVVVASNHELSQLAGRCSEKTISREVQLHERLGIISVKQGWRIVKGKRLRTRSISLAVPDPFPAEISINETVLHLDICVSISKPVHLDTCVSRTPGHPCVPSLLSHDGGHDAA